MKLAEYFEQKNGLGVLATADAEGRVNTAIYARPHVEDRDNLCFIMTERKTYANLKENPHASYLFKEEGSAGADGVRLLLRKTREEADAERIKQLMRRRYAPEDVGTLHLVHFHVEEILPLVSSGKCPITG